MQKPILPKFNSLQQIVLTPPPKKMEHGIIFKIYRTEEPEQNSCPGRGTCCLMTLHPQSVLLPHSWGP